MLVPEQTLSKGAVESFHYRLVPVNLLAPTANFWFVFFHLFGDSAHELTPRVHLQKLWPFQRPAFENVLKSARDFGRVFRGQGFSFFETAGHIDDSQSVFVCCHAQQYPVEGKECLPGERLLGWTGNFWSEECILAQEDRFAKGLGASAIF